MKIEKIINFKLNKKSALFKKITDIVIICFLIMFWFWASINITSNYGVTSLVYEYDKKNYINYKSDQLLKNQYIKASFESKDQNLGIVAVRFNTFNRINSDRILFRLREIGSEDWLYTNVYKVDQFQPDKFFTFGFSPIVDSYKRNYEFELISLNGVKGDAVALSNIEPVFITVHSFSRSELLSSSSGLGIFILKKFFNFFNSLSSTITTFVYLMPLLFYYVIKKNYNKLTNNFRLIFYIYIFSLLCYIFFINQINILFGILFFIFWLIIVYKYKFESRISYFISLLSLILSLILLIIGEPFRAEKAALVFYYFLVMGFVVSLCELKFKFKNTKSLSEFLQSLKTLNDKI